MKLSEAACHLGIGLVAGLVGTAAITASQMIEMRIRGRKQSTTPAKAVEKVLGIEPINRLAEERLSTLTHWGYGTGWGTFRSVLGVIGVHGPVANGLHTGAIYGTALVMLPSLKVAPPAREWGLKELGIELFHHAVYGVAAGTTYDILCQRALGTSKGRSAWNLLVGGLTAIGLRQLSQSLEQRRRARGPLARSRRIASVVWQRDWPRAIREFDALRRDLTPTGLASVSMTRVRH